MNTEIIAQYFILLTKITCFPLKVANCTGARASPCFRTALPAEGYADLLLRKRRQRRLRLCINGTFHNLLLVYVVWVTACLCKQNCELTNLKPK